MSGIDQAYQYTVDHIDLANQWVKENTNGRNISDVLESVDNLATAADAGMAVGGVAVAIAGGTIAVPALTTAAVGAGLLVAYKAVKSVAIDKLEEMAAKEALSSAVKNTSEVAIKSTVSRESFIENINRAAKGISSNSSSLTSAGKLTEARFNDQVIKSGEKAVENFPRQKVDLEIEGLDAGRAAQVKSQINDYIKGIEKERGQKFDLEERERLFNSFIDSYKPDTKIERVSSEDIIRQAGQHIYPDAQRKMEVDIRNAVNSIIQDDKNRIILPGANEVKSNNIQMRDTILKHLDDIGMDSRSLSY